MQPQLPAKYDELSPSQRRTVREAYVKLQHGRCRFCKAPLEGQPAEVIRNKRIFAKLFPPGFLNNPVHLHHNHDTGMTLGAVHAHCNAVLWQYHGE